MDAYETREIVHKGRSLTVTWMYDQDHEPPWVDDDGRGVMHEGRKHRNKAPGEVIITSPHGSLWFFDWSETTKKAKRDGWGCDLDTFMKLTARHRRVPTRKMCVRESVLWEYEFMRGWLHDEWTYCGIVVTDDETGAEASCWGIEGHERCSEYHEEVILNLAEEVYLPSIERLMLGQVA